MKFTEEQLEKAKGAKSAEELLAFAKESGVEMTEDEAKKYFADLHKEGELADDELENVSGGGCGGESQPKATETYWGSAVCPFCSGQIQVANIRYDDNSIKQTPDSCLCGASIKFNHTTNIVCFTENGEARDVVVDASACIRY